MAEVLKPEAHLASAAQVVGMAVAAAVAALVAEKLLLAAQGLPVSL